MRTSVQDEIDFFLMRGGGVEREEDEVVQPQHWAEMAWLAGEAYADGEDATMHCMQAIFGGDCDGEGEWNLNIHYHDAAADVCG